MSLSEAIASYNLNAALTGVSLLGFVVIVQAAILG